MGIDNRRGRVSICSTTYMHYYYGPASQLFNPSKKHFSIHLIDLLKKLCCPFLYLTFPVSLHFGYLLSQDLTYLLFLLLCLPITSSISSLNSYISSVHKWLYTWISKLHPLLLPSTCIFIFPFHLPFKPSPLFWIWTETILSPLSASLPQDSPPNHSFTKKSKVGTVYRLWWRDVKIWKISK